MTSLHHGLRFAACVIVVAPLALGCGRYGKPIRPEPRVEPPPVVEAVPEEVPAGEPDFRLDLPGIGGEDEDE